MCERLKAMSSYLVSLYCSTVYLILRFTILLQISRLRENYDFHLTPLFLILHQLNTRFTALLETTVQQQSLSNHLRRSLSRTTSITLLLLPERNVAVVCLFVNLFPKNSRSFPILFRCLVFESSPFVHVDASYQLLDRERKNIW